MLWFLCFLKIFQFVLHFYSWLLQVDQHLIYFSYQLTCPFLTKRLFIIIWKRDILGHFSFWYLICFLLLDNNFNLLLTNANIIFRYIFHIFKRNMFRFTRLTHLSESLLIPSLSYSSVMSYWPLPHSSFFLCFCVESVDHSLNIWLQIMNTLQHVWNNPNKTLWNKMKYVNDQ